MLIPIQNRIKAACNSCEWIILILFAGIFALFSCTTENDSPLLELQSKIVHLDASGKEHQTINIVANRAWNLSTGQADWLIVTPQTSQSDTTAISITANPNMGAERSATIRITTEELPEQLITITQEAIKIIPNFDYTDESDRYFLNDKSYSIPDSPGLKEEWEIVDGEAKIQKGENIYFILPYTESNNSTIKVRLTITSQNHSVDTIKNLPLPQTTWYRIYAIGKEVAQQKSNDVNRDWYIDQTNTGTYSIDNCGPACATMALKWVYPDFSLTTEDARNTYLPTGGYWSTSTIMNYLNLHNAQNNVIQFSETKINNLIAALDAGDIAILCLDIYYVRTQTKGEQWALDKFYTTLSADSGHFIIVKGYTIVNNQLFFEVYDPWSNGKKYPNGIYLGCNRFYRAEDLIKATNVWWRYAIIIPPAMQQTRSSIAPYIIDTNHIPVQWGK